MSKYAVKSSEDSYDLQPVPPAQLQPAKRFAGAYAGEHVAGTEFVIGALFVGAGAAAGDVLIGLLVGNALAVLTWALITAPIAVDTRLSLYAYLRKIAGPLFIKVYSVVNGIMFLGLAGSMITVSASAVRISYNLGVEADIPTQVGLFPTDIRFVLIVLIVGAVVVVLAALGFRRLAQFATAVAPWMICMFLIGALATYPSLALNAGLGLPALDWDDIYLVLSTEVYQPRPMEGPFWAIANEAQSVWSIAAFAWVANLAMHGSLGDMTLLRFARSKSYGWFSALGMFIGHYAAWVFAGVMGASAALVLRQPIGALDPGDVATQALGVSGVIAVIIAGWTTSNPTLYRAGLAFQSLAPGWSRTRMTLAIGVITVVIACSPFVFSQLLGYVGWMGLALSPVGAIIVTEHWLFPRLGLTRYWSDYSGRALNAPALLAWVAAASLVAVLYFGVGIHQFFLLLPAWFTAAFVYIGLAYAAGAGKAYAQSVVEEAATRQRQQAEVEYLEVHGSAAAAQMPVRSLLDGLGLFTLAGMTGFGVWVLTAPVDSYAERFLLFKSLLIWPTLFFFVIGGVRVALAQSD